MAGIDRTPDNLDWRYTETRRRNFLAKLAEAYDTEAALAAAGLNWPQVCELRARHPDFAERIEEVIAAGYDRLEAALLRHAGLGGTIDPALAQAMLKQRRTGKTEAAVAQRRAKGPAPSQRQMIRTIMDELAPLKAAARGGMLNGRGDAGSGSDGAGAADG